jgi:hypothetical protein
MKHETLNTLEGFFACLFEDGNASKERLVERIPSWFSLNKEMRNFVEHVSIYAKTAEAWDYLEKYYPRFMEDALRRVSVHYIEKLSARYADPKILQIDIDAVSNTAWIEMHKNGGYLDRLADYNSFTHALRCATWNATDKVIKKEYGCSYIPVQRKGIDAQGNPYKYTDYIRMTEQKHEIDDEGHVIDTWDLYADSLRFYPYCVDTAEKACNNIALHNFFSTLNADDKQVLRLLQEGYSNVRIGQLLHVSHTVINRRVKRLKKRFIYEISATEID